MEKNIDPRDFHDVSLNFLKTELETGLTFARLAADAKDDAEKHARNRERAQIAYESLLHFAPKVAMSPAEARQIQSGIEELRSAVEALGHA